MKFKENMGVDRKFVVFTASILTFPASPWQSEYVLAKSLKIRCERSVVVIISSFFFLQQSVVLSRKNKDVATNMLKQKKNGLYNVTCLRQHEI